MFELQLFVPELDERGSRFSRAHHEAFELVVMASFGGIMRYPSNMAPSMITRRGTIVYGIPMQSLMKVVALEQVIEFAKIHYEQPKVTVRYLGLTEEV